MSKSPTRLLVVDDEEDLELLIRQRFRRLIRQGEIDFVFAHNGKEALEKLAEHPEIRLVLSDINMPVMDGLTLLSQLEDIRPEIRAVIVSAYGDMENIRTAMNRGAFDFVTKPIDFNDLEITIRKTLKHIETMESALESRDRLVAIRRELEVATEMQMSVLPRDRSHSATHEIQAMMIPAREIGGDFYNFFSLDDPLIGLIIADVSGKGIPAALFTMVTQTLLKGAVRNFASPARCLSEVNELLAEDNESCVFVTVFYGILDLRNGRFRYCNGGHNPPRLVRGDSGVEVLPMTGNVVLGVFPGHDYADGEVQLKPGDTLFLYTDGISEAQNARNEEFGEERLDEKLTSLKQATARDVVNEVVDAVNLFAEDTPQSDDITCIVLRFNAVLSA